MKDDHDRYTDAWLDKLDAIVAGDDVPLADDDQLLPVAKRLATALAPLRTMDSGAERRRQHLLIHLHVKHSNITRKSIRRLFRPSLLIAALLLFVLVIGMMSTGGLTAAWDSAAHVWQASTSLDQIKGVSVASLSRPHAGLKPLPLLPAVLPGDTQASSYGVITDTSNPNVLTTFVADYHIAGQDVLLYEQPSYGPFSSSAAKIVRIGSIEGQLFQDDAGTNALQWYQHGMVCQITSKLPVERLVKLASVFQPIKSWDLIL